AAHLDLADDRFVLLAASAGCGSSSGSACRCGTSCCGGRLSWRTTEHRRRELLHEGGRDGDRADRDQRVDIQRAHLLGGQALGADPGAAGGAVVYDTQRLHLEGCVPPGNVLVVNDDVAAGGVAAEGDLTGHRGELTAVQEHERYRRVRVGHRRLPDDELRAEVEWDRRARRDRSPRCLSLSCAAVDEHQLTTALVND